jgi:lipoprotein-anchoring transpeptidase ErfK/SrfK
MQRVGNTGRGFASWQGRTMAATVSIVALIGLSACTSSTKGGTSQSPVAQSSSGVDGSSSAPSSSSAPPVAAAVITSLPADGAKTVNPATPVTVNVANGKLTSVKLTNSAGKTVSGALAAGGSSWHSTEVLGYSKIYQLTATAQDAEGRPTVKHGTITTVTPNNQTMPYFKTIYGTDLQRGATYGVGMIAEVQFDEPVPDRRAAEKLLTVTTTPHVSGAWYWTDDHTAHWRPMTFYKTGTTVHIDAKVYGANLGGGLYGQSDTSTSFKIGAKHVAIADAKTHQVKVWFNNKFQRSMPTSMGQGGYVAGKNGQISLWTMPGYYTVINHENPATMSSDSYGLPANSPYGYAPEKVPYATKISIDGIYLHELDTTVNQQGNTNVSHGCLNLNYTNAKWYYENSVVGDVVKVINSGGPTIQVFQGGDWSLPWTQWVKGGNV